MVFQSLKEKTVRFEKTTLCNPFLSNAIHYMHRVFTVTPLHMRKTFVIFHIFSTAFKRNKLRTHEKNDESNSMGSCLETTVKS